MKKIEKLDLKKWEVNERTILSEVPIGKIRKFFFGPKYETIKVPTEGVFKLADIGKIIIEVETKINEIIDVLNKKEKKNEK